MDLVKLIGWATGAWVFWTVLGTVAAVVTQLGG